MNEFQVLTEYLKTTLAYRIGLLLIEARGSLSKSFLLPYKLYKLSQNHKNKNVKLIEYNSIPGEIEDEVLKFLACERDDDYTLMRQRGRTDNDISKILLLAARVTLKTSVNRAKALAEDAYRLATELKQKTSAIILIYDSGSIQSAYDKIQEMQLDQCLGSAKIKRICDEASILRDGYVLPNKQIGTYSGIKKSMLYVSHLSIPYHSSGYATRTHSMMQALVRNEVDVTCVTRPGYPLDRTDSKYLSQVKRHEKIDGVEYKHVGLNTIINNGTLEFFHQASRELINIIQNLKPNCIVAGSNYVNALPALIAARKLGLPFAYDIRGLWEYTSASKFNYWEYTERFFLTRYLETLVAAEADKVFAISSPLRDELINRGVDSEKISLLPNGVDLAKFNVPTPSHGLRKKLNIDEHSVVFGFIGSLEVYEGLDDILHAFKMLLSKGTKCHLVIVGDGSCARQLGELVLKLGLPEHVRLIGRVPFSDVGQYYGLCDVFVYPRMETHVTRIVPALKPLEAMAAKKAVIISNLPALVELVGGEENAAVVKPGSPGDLFKVMSSLCKEETRHRLGLKGYSYATKHKTWQSSVAEMCYFATHPQ